MISTPASNMRMRSRFDDCRVSKLEISREKNGRGAKLIAISATGTAHATARGGAKLIAISATGTAHATARGFFITTSTSTAATHPIHALRVYVISTPNDETMAVAARYGLRRSCSHSASAN